MSADPKVTVSVWGTLKSYTDPLLTTTTIGQFDDLVETAKYVHSLICTSLALKDDPDSSLDPKLLAASDPILYAYTVRDILLHGQASDAEFKTTLSDYTELLTRIIELSDLMFQPDYRGRQWFHAESAENEDDKPKLSSILDRFAEVRTSLTPLVEGSTRTLDTCAVMSHIEEGKEAGKRIWKHREKLSAEAIEYMHRATILTAAISVRATALQWPPLKQRYGRSRRHGRH